MQLPVTAIGTLKVARTEESNSRFPIFQQLRRQRRRDGGVQRRSPPRLRPAVMQRSALHAL